MMRLVSILLCLHLPVAAIASKLPDPLSLPQVMKMANQADHYTLIDAQADVVEAQSQRELAESLLGFSAQLELQAAYVNPSSVAFDPSSQDNGAVLRLTQPLYDFGGSSNNIQAAQIDQQALQARMTYVINSRKIEIAKQFFEVILSDLKYAWDNEALSIAYVRYDAVKDRHALLQVSDLVLLESEGRYLDTLHTRNLSEAQQRYSRAVLAETLNRPAELPSNLVRPELKFLQTKLPEYASILEKVLKNNPQIMLAEKQQTAAQQRMLAENQQLSPFLSAELEVSEYSRAKSNDDVRVALNLTIPLYESSNIKSRISKARAALLKQRAQLLSIKAQVRKQALNVWQTISVLNKRRQQLQMSQELRELKLDQNRALYEMEVETDLGDAMVAISEIQYEQAKNEYELALAWMELRLLVGKTEMMGATL
jgi:outer membrane protein TolC